MRITLTFALQLCSDYHISSGHRSELVDSALFRDADGIPAIRGTTLTALLRDGLRRLIIAANADGATAKRRLTQQCEASGLTNTDAYCGQFAHVAEDCPVCRIFGSPRNRKHWIFSSARPQQLTAPQTPVKYPNWASQDTMRVRVDPRSRRAEPRKLFSQEDGDSRLIFTFTVSSIAAEASQEDAALIIAAARMVRNIGAARRRGRGECLIRLDSARINGSPVGTQDEWLGKFKTYWLLGKDLDPFATDAPDPNTGPKKKKETGKPLRLRLLIRTDEPVLVARRAENGNEFDGLDYIPGTVVRGAFAQMVAGALGRSLDNNNNSPLRVHFIELFFTNRVRFSPLYPVSQAGGQYRQGFPVPHDFMTCKLHHGLEKNDAGVLGKMSNSHENSECRICKGKEIETKLEQLEGFICVTASGEVAAIKNENLLEMHNTINPDTGRVLETNLFAYHAVPAGSYFEGEISCKNENLGTLLRELAGLPGWNGSFELHLGKATQRGYGRISAVLQIVDDNKVAPCWIGQKITRRVTDWNGTLYLNLLTDAIVPDCWGRFYTRFEEGWLGEVLQLPVKIEQQFVKARNIDAFNAYLGLPRWRDVAIAAGSSCAFRIDTDNEGYGEAIKNLRERWVAQSGGDANASDADLQVLRWQFSRLEREGIGLRCNQGFGRVAFNHPIYLDPAELKDWWFPVPEGLRLKSASKGLSFTLAATFHEVWDEKLLQMPLDRCDHANFGAVARLLRTEAPVLITENGENDDLFAGLKRRLNSLGDPSQLDTDLPQRDKKNWFKEGAGQDGMGQIFKAIKALASMLKEQDDREQRNESAITGIDMLAERIAAVANQAE